jgi:hypothetical protein
VPLVHDHQLEVFEEGSRVGAGEQQRQALGCGDECSGEPLALAGSNRGSGIAGTRFDGPGKAQILDWCAERIFRVRSERSEWSDPEDG